MQLRIAWALISALICSEVQSALPADLGSSGREPQHRIVAYLAGWSAPPVIHPEQLTHINFAFAHIDKTGGVVFDEPAVGQSLLRLQALKKINPRLKFIISVGGWQAEGFSDAALTDSSRRRFAQSAVALLREYAADGIDLDWEYPGQGVAGIKYRSEDKHNFTLLLKTMREQLDRAVQVGPAQVGAAAHDAESTEQKRTASARYCLTIAAADREYFDHTEMDRLHVYLDWINLMSYDFFNSLTPTTGHHAGLYRSEHAAPTDRNADAAVKQYLAAGVPADKIVLGVAFYGRGFAGVTPVSNGVNQPYRRFEGEHTYAELAGKFVDQQGFIRYWDGNAQAPYLWNSASRTFITYDDPQSIQIKTRYILEHRLGGVMFWELSQDRDGELLDVITRTISSADRMR